MEKNEGVIDFFQFLKVWFLKDARNTTERQTESKTKILNPQMLIG